MNGPDVCAVCGQHVGARARIEGYTAYWNEEEGESLRSTICVLHTECYMRLSPDERDALLERAREAQP